MGENDEALGLPREEIHVLVTGFGPWAANKINPAFLIARAMHEGLEMVPGGPRICVHGLPEAVRVSYKAVRAQIPPLLFPPVTHDPRPTFDVVLFVGMAESRSYYSVETLAHRDDYKSVDGDGTTLDPVDRDLWRDAYGAPETLAPAWNAEDVWRRWKARSDGEDVRVSEDAGRYLCEFIYYTGLVEYWRRGRADAARIAFLHVPGNHDAQSVERGVRVAESLVVALVESSQVKGRP